MATKYLKTPVLTVSGSIIVGGRCPRATEKPGEWPPATEKPGERPGLCRPPSDETVTPRALPPQRGAAGVTDNTSSQGALACGFFKK